MKYKLMSAIMAFSMLVSSTIAPLAASKSYASAEIEENPTIMNEKIDEVGNDEKPNEISDTKLDIPDKTEEINENSPVETKTEKEKSGIQAEEETKKETTTEENLEEEIEEKVKIVKKSVDVDLYEDSSYYTISNEDIDIKITGQMPENGTIKAYEIQNAVTDMEKVNVLGFGFGIFDKDGNLYDKNLADEYEIEIRSEKISDLDKIYIYEKNKNNVRFTETRDFSKLSDKVKVDSRADEFAIAKDIEKEEKQTQIEKTGEEEKSPFLSTEDKKEVNEKNLAEKEIEKPKDMLDSLTNSAIEKQDTEASNEKADEKTSSDLELVDWKKDLLDTFAGNLENEKPVDEENSEETSNNEETVKEDNQSENLTTDLQVTDEKEEGSEVKTDATTESNKNEELDKETSKGNIEKSETNEEIEEKLTYQQVLAEIYTDSSYGQKADDQTRIKLSGKLPGYTKVKAYPVEITIEGKEVLAAYDITIFDENDDEYKVTEKNDIQVQITNQKIKEADEVDVYHKENKFAPEEKISVENKSKDTVTFKAESFSIYAVTSPEARAITFVFLNKNEKGEREVWDTQTIRDGEKLIEPELPIFSYKGKFEGWHYYDIETDTLGEKFDFDKPVAVTESSPKIIYLKGKYPDVAYINFIDRKEVKNSDGSIRYVNEVLSTKEIPLGSKVTTEDVPVLPGESGTVFSHWATKPEGSTAFDFNTPITKGYIQSVQGADNFVKLNLYAVFKKALTVTFDSQGGTHVNNQVVYSGNKLNLNDLTKPVRPGYDFKYWSTSPNGRQFNANTPITKDMTLYAVWTPRVVKYTINHFMENADDSGYSLYKSETRTANAGTYTNADSSTYKLPASTMNNEKIHYVRADERKIIRGDDSTEINLYYDRDRFTFRIFESYVFYETDVVKVDLKWGADTKPYFEEALRKLPSGYTFKENGIAGQTVTSPPRMPKNNYQLLAWREGKNEWNVRIIDVETNQLIRLDAKTSQLSSSLQGYTGGEIIPGYTYKYVERPGNDFARPSTRHADGKTSEQNEVWVFYQRNRHTLTFATNGNGPDIVRDNILYDSSLAKYAPENYIIGQTKNGEGKIFAGWFDNSNGAGNPVDLKTMTMPDNDLKLYAKWEEPIYTVRAYKQRNNPDAGVIELKVKRGNTVDRTKLSADKPPVAQQTQGSELRWYAYINGTLTEYNFNDPVYSDLFLYPVWLAPVGDEFRPLSQIYRVKYKAPQEGGTDYIYTDPNDYVNNAEAIVIPPYVNNDYRFPPDKDNPTGKQLSMPKDKVFEGWVIDKNSEFTSVTDPNMLNKIYRPGDIVNVIGNIMFKPVFNEFRVTKLTLKEIAPNGSKLDDIVYESRNKPSNLPSGINDNRPTEDLRNNDIIKLPQPRATNTTGFTFLGWSTTEDPTQGRIFKPDQEVMITDENTPNILYGIWERDKYKVTIRNDVIGDYITDNDKKFKVSYTLEGKTYEKVYTIENGASVDVEIPYGSNISIESLSDRLVKYKYKDSIHNSKTFSLDSLVGDIEVIFETQPIPPPTGIIDNIAPMAIMLALAIMAFAYRFYKKDKVAGGIDE
ncbi:InlB B-repeat-containing protein [Anaerococcus sp. Marseille-Q5996]|uniref:InlB B-repeat-containing protein n=1 Tax=Anaerococcus sp. Marseille-Q5996 TaxID=2972769 RepID=UPI0021C62990|nr:InlB B-repeat-containing protein [Anaerococcus sp. Marseille-Q5996]